MIINRSQVLSFYKSLNEYKYTFGSLRETAAALYSIPITYTFSEIISDIEHRHQNAITSEILDIISEYVFVTQTELEFFKLKYS
jgi:hypothetical protein